MENVLPFKREKIKQLNGFNVIDITTENDIAEAKLHLSFWKNALKFLHGLTAEEVKEIFNIETQKDYLAKEFLLIYKIEEADKKLSKLINKKQ